jgi:HlyD family secretion protein
MADLTKVRVRALVNETDIGNVRPGQSTRVTVDAYPERPFQGVVEKIEPQAVVQQSVTMFPVIVSLNNNEGLLKPGMNGEVSLLVERRENVVAVSNDAVKTLREASTAALLVGLDPDSVSAMVREQQAAMRGTGNGNATKDAAPRQAVAMDSGRSKGASPAPSSIRARTALVFVEIAAGKYEPRIVRLGAANYDYSEVISGLKEGEQVASLAVASLQAKRDQQNERFRSMTGGGGVPGMQATPAAGGGRPKER